MSSHASITATLDLQCLQVYVQTLVFHTIYLYVDLNRERERERECLTTNYLDG